MDLLSLHSTRRKVRCVLLLPLHDACAKGSVYLGSFIAGGSTYCGVGALSLLGKLPIPSRDSFALRSETSDECELGNDALQNLVRYLVYRQVLFEDGDDRTYSPVERERRQDIQRVQTPTLQEMIPSFAFSTSEAMLPSSNATKSIAPSERLICAGLNGRCNKVADTCYSWWAGGTLGVSHLPLVYPNALSPLLA